MLKKLGLIACSLVVALSVFLVGEEVNAAPSPGEHLQGTDPISTGCANDAITVKSASVGSWGTIYLRYSPTCRTAWAKFVLSRPANDYPYEYIATVTRFDGGRALGSYSCRIYYGQTSCYTKQVNDMGYVAAATGQVEYYDDIIAYGVAGYY